jgi:hypothetical protein
MPFWPPGFLSHSKNNEASGVLREKVTLAFGIAKNYDQEVGFCLVGLKTLFRPLSLQCHQFERTTACEDLFQRQTDPIDEPSSLH